MKNGNAHAAAALRGVVAPSDADRRLRAVLDEAVGMRGSACLGIMGGTFDPIHIGHLTCAQRAVESLGLDAVLFVPTNVSAFKLDRDAASAADRLSMCALAVAGNPRFFVSDVEIARGGVTYTVDTLRVLRDALPEAVELAFIVGADAAATLLRWREAPAIARLARIAAVERPGSAVSPDEAARLAQAGFSVSFVEGGAIDVSSSEVRDRVIAGASIRYLVPDEVACYIMRHGLYLRRAEDGARRDRWSGERGESRMSCGGGAGNVSDALSEEFFEKRRAELAERVSKKRFRHIEGVVRAASSLARVYGVDEREARLAALLHDWDKGYDDAGIRARVVELGMSDMLDPWVVARVYGVDEREARLAALLHDWDKGYDDAGIRARVVELGMSDMLDPWVVENVPATLHGHTAAVALGRAHPEIPRSVLQAVWRHTSGATDMTPLDMVVYIADAIEDSRQFGRIDELRAMVGDVSLEELFVGTYEYWAILLFERGKPVHPDTIKVWNSYAVKRAARKGK